MDMVDWGCSFVKKNEVNRYEGGGMIMSKRGVRFLNKKRLGRGEGVCRLLSGK